jgi:hypothetical protein
MMIRNLEMEPSLAADIVDPEGTVKLLTDALDMYLRQPRCAMSLHKIVRSNPLLRDRRSPNQAGSLLLYEAIRLSLLRP